MCSKCGPGYLLTITVTERLPLIEFAASVVSRLNSRVELLEVNARVVRGELPLDLFV
jgi:hypothetical protein